MIPPQNPPQNLFECKKFKRFLVKYPIKYLYCNKLATSPDAVSRGYFEFSKRLYPFICFMRQIGSVFVFLSYLNSGL